tara:strand:- start:2267 stop:2470 length:204 start_codon:yes stop_codon:yes gene_type:complete
MRVILLKSEDEIRYLILYTKEKLLHEDVSDMENHSIPHKFTKLDDDEMRGVIRSLRWVIDDRDEDWV